MIPLSSVCVGVGELASFLLTLFKVSLTPLDSLIQGFQTFPRAAGLGFPSFLIGGRGDGVWKWRRGKSYASTTPVILLQSFLELCPQFGSH